MSTMNEAAVHCTNSASSVRHAGQNGDTTLLSYTPQLCSFGDYLILYITKGACFEAVQFFFQLQASQAWRLWAISLRKAGQAL